VCDFCFVCLFVDLVLTCACFFSPSLSVESNLDFGVKTSMLTDLFGLVGCEVFDRSKPAYVERRPFPNNFSPEQAKQMCEETLAEKNRSGGENFSIFNGGSCFFFFSDTFLQRMENAGSCNDRRIGQIHQRGKKSNLSNLERIFGEAPMNICLFGSFVIGREGVWWWNMKNAFET
jgi:hypothetical protein